jgi:hypothetical protein
MKIAPFLVAFGATIAFVTADTCDNNGSLLSRDWIWFHAERGCNGYNGVQGKFQETFRPGEKKRAW